MRTLVLVFALFSTSCDLGVSVRTAPNEVASRTAQVPRASATSVVNSIFTDRAWVRLADAPDGRSHVAKAVVDGQVYVIGGLLGGAAGSGPTPTVQHFDPGSRLWSTADAAPQPFDHAAATAVAGSVYVFGGNSDQPTVAALRYEVTSHRWTAVRAMPEPRAAGGAVTIGSVIYVAGGYATRPDEPLASAYRYEPVADAWEPLPPLPTPRQHAAMVAYRGQACVIGGGQSAGAASTAVECYDPGVNRWSVLPALPTAASDFDATTVGDLIVCAGGGNLQGQIVSIFDGTTWKRGPELAVNRYGVAVASVGRTVYVLQGASVMPPYPAGVVEALTLP